MLSELLEAWRTNDRINFFLIDRISPEGMKCSLSKRGGRNVVRQFAHLHNNRVYQLENRARDLAEKLVKFESKEEPSKAKLKKYLKAFSRFHGCKFEFCFNEVHGTGDSPKIISSH